MKHTDELRQQIRWVLKDKYQWSSAQILRAFEEEKFPPEIQRDISRLEAGEPVQYVIGWVDFLGARIDLSLRPLIPRPETEYWVEQVMRELPDTPLQILDLCCGSGCIGIALLKHFPQVRVDFADISDAALQQTAENLESNHVEKERSCMLKSNLFEPLGQQTFTQYDIIFSNPPYVDPAGNLSPELRFEPSQALFAQDHGFALIEQIILDLKNFLKPQGRAYLEFGENQSRRIVEIAEKNAMRADIFDDQFGRPRFARISPH